MVLVWFRITVLAMQVSAAKAVSGLAAQLEKARLLDMSDCWEPAALFRLSVLSVAVLFRDV